MSDGNRIDNLIMFVKKQMKRDVIVTIYFENE